MTSWDVAGFEELYASVGEDLDQVPWARMGPNPTLVEWLDTRPAPPGRALVIACGLGDDAEELARRGHRVTAFDLSETAIGWCRKRFPQSDVDYQVADLLDPPAQWAGAFDLVVELYTIQSLPLGTRPQAVAAVAAPVAAGGALFVRCFARPDDAPVDVRPWPVSRAELGWFTGEGLTEVSLAEDVTESGTRFFVGVYRR
ncbi:class I SAM-dependent methyltransferase [Actinophytocola sp.]|uniref:class I SAM-dependent methyltransferase n=1 Tax=Actinophytocola sp. TaxID=1872138 RepID=UPI0025C05E0E|nr:class I SAM-dependent methyltransferase [Actinophytocola sp.]